MCVPLGDLPAQPLQDGAAGRADAWPTLRRPSHRPGLRNDLIIDDELGFAPIDDTAAELLFRFAAAYEPAASASAPHRPIEAWGSSSPGHTAVSLLDRLLHRYNTVITDGESYRMRQPGPEEEPDENLEITEPGSRTSPGHQREPRTGH